MQVKYIFITGGVVSSLGKGLTSASIGNLLESRGLKIAMLKLDPYLNVDPGTMNPFQHGEVYVTDDGAETDLDLGHYYRYTNTPLSKASNATSGQIYNTVIKRERKGEYLGQTVQVIPHVTDEIKKRILDCSIQEEGTNLVLVEIGGTVGDIESLPFLEAIRQFRNERPHDCINIHLTYVPYLKAAGEVKTKPTQHSTGELRSIGIMPDIILCRSENVLSDQIKEKIALFCNVSQDSVIDEPDVEKSIYEVPLQLSRQKLDDTIIKRLSLSPPKSESNTAIWEKIIHTISYPKEKVTIGVVGKYIDHQDAYKSVIESLNHAALSLDAELKVRYIDADKVSEKSFLGCDGFLVPGGFGERGWTGKIQTARFCREKKIPYFGICLGMQIMAIEFARHVLDLSDSHSTEIDPNTPYPIISLLSEQENILNMGGTMRLGAYPCKLDPASRAFKAYNVEEIQERHRHRYEFNNAFKSDFEKNGFLFSGIWEEGMLAEIVEIVDHPWMVGTQFHPEFKSKPSAAHPLFKSFISAAIKEQKDG